MARGVQDVKKRLESGLEDYKLNTRSVKKEISKLK